MAQTVWRGHVTFGLVSFPVRLFKAARPEKTTLRRLYRPAQPEPEPAPEPPASGKGREATPRRGTPPPEPPPEPVVYKTENRVIAPAAPPQRSDAGSQDDSAVDWSPPSSELVKGYEYEKGRYVVLEDDELKSLAVETSKEMQIVEFVRLAEIDPIFFETSYYMSPEEAGERPYALLFKALQEAEYVGLAQVAMHRREHVVAVRAGRSGLIAHTMFFANEIRAAEEFRTDTNGINARELDLAKRLIDTMAVRFEPEKFRDTRQERLQALIDAKVAGRQVTAEKPAGPRSAPVIDIFEALQSSLNALKKPAAATAEAKRPRKKRAS